MPVVIDFTRKNKNLVEADSYPILLINWQKFIPLIKRLELKEGYRKIF